MSPDVAQGPLAVDDLVSPVERIFLRCGLSPEDAHPVADALVEADMRGVPSHGVRRVTEYVGRLGTAGGVDPRGRPRVARDAGACLVVDGGNAIGQGVADYAMRQAIARAGDTGIAAVAVRGSNHCGAMARYAMQALPHDTASSRAARKKMGN